VSCTTNGHFAAPSIMWCHGDSFVRSSAVCDGKQRDRKKYLNKSDTFLLIIRNTFVANNPELSNHKLPTTERERTFYWFFESFRLIINYNLRWLFKSITRDFRMRLGMDFHFCDAYDEWSRYTSRWNCHQLSGAVTWNRLKKSVSSNRPPFV